MLTIEVGGRPLTLLPQKAGLLPGSDTLMSADAHIGKAVSFRRLGVPVPRGTTSETLARLAGLVARHAVRRIVFLGDLLHSAREHAALELLLVRGNHDDRAGDPPPSLGFRVVDEPFEEDGLALCHRPAAREGRYVLAGHLHPCVSLGGRARDRLRLPCFHIGERVGVLPAFGSFTGMHPIDLVPGRRAVVVAEGSVTELPT